jgi:photosystem II stability/assembly factor-like uncharacterized protein
LLVRNESGFDVNNNFFQREALFITADGGSTWQPVAGPPATLFQASYVLADAATIYALQSWGQALYRTTDRGATWHPVPVPSGMFFGFDRPLRAFGPNRLLLTDAAGQSYLSVDGGATWASSTAMGPAGSDFASVWFFDAREGAAWTWDGGGVRTTDGGQSWTPFVSQTHLGLRRVQFLADGSVGWLQSNFGVIHRSTDRGRVWVAPAGGTYPLQGVEDFHFIDAMRGWAVSPYGDAGQSALWMTGDGGTTWTLPPTAKAGYGFLSLRFADATHGVAVGPAGVALVTSDGGLTWSPRPTGATGNLRRVTFADATTAIAVGDFGAIVRSTDRGATWSVVSGPMTGNLYDIRFVSASVGHAVGDQGTVLLTRDGGLTWTSADTATWRTLLSVFFVDAMTGWVSGTLGTILATATGGR